MGETIRCHQCRWLRTHGPCDQWFYYCALDDGCDVRELNRMWRERSGNERMVNQLDGTCDHAERKPPELKPCPFCGTEPHWHEFADGMGFVVWCVNDECAVRPFTHVRDTREQAIADWNGRA